MSLYKVVFIPSPDWKAQSCVFHTYSYVLFKPQLLEPVLRSDTQWAWQCFSSSSYLTSRNLFISLNFGKVLDIFNTLFESNVSVLEKQCNYLSLPCCWKLFVPTTRIIEFYSRWNIRDPFFPQGTEISIFLYYHRVPDKCGTWRIITWVVLILFYSYRF